VEGEECYAYLGGVDQVQIDLVDAELMGYESLVSTCMRLSYELTSFKDFSSDFRGSALPPVSNSQRVRLTVSYPTIV
jgi:hypothetical protein